MYCKNKFKLKRPQWQSRCLFINKKLNIISRSGGTADAHDSKSCGKPCGFKSHLRHQIKNKSNYYIRFIFFWYIFFTVNTVLKLEIFIFKFPYWVTDTAYIIFKAYIQFILWNNINQLITANSTLFYSIKKQRQKWRCFWINDLI